MLLVRKFVPMFLNLFLLRFLVHKFIFDRSMSLNFFPLRFLVVKLLKIKISFLILKISLNK